MAVYEGQIGRRREPVEMVQTWLLRRGIRPITIPFMEAPFNMDLYFPVQCDWESLHCLPAGACERVLCRPL